MRVLSTEKQLVAAGAEVYDLGTAHCWHDFVNGAFDTKKLSLQAIDKEALRTADRRYPFVVDIEAWNLEHDTKTAISNIVTGIMRWRSNQPNRPTGIYGTIPVTSYWVPVQYERSIRQWTNGRQQRRQQFEQWQRLNDVVAEAIVPLVDFLCPSIYYYYPGQDEQWREFAGHALDESRRIADGKPIYPMVMPSVHPGTSAIATESWRDVIDFIAESPLVSGIAVHHSKTYVMADDWTKPFARLLTEAPDQPH